MGHGESKGKGWGDASLAVLGATPVNWRTFRTAPSSGPLPAVTDTRGPCLMDLSSELGVSTPSNFLLIKNKFGLGEVYKVIECLL